MSAEQQAAEAAQTEENKEVVEQVAATEADQEQQANQPPSIEELAGSMGWVPQDRFKGPQEKWKPAHQFILDGHDIQTRTSRELKEMRTTLETVARTSGQIMADKLQQQHEELTRKYAAAVEKGDAEESFKISGQIHDIQQKAKAVASPQSGPTPETEAWVQRNARVKSDPVAWQRALAISDAYARTYPNAPVADQLAYTEQNLKREFPHLFDDKPAPQVNGNISRNSAAPAKTGKTAADLPAEARAIARDLVERGLIANEESYAQNYFAAQARKA